VMARPKVVWISMGGRKLSPAIGQAVEAAGFEFSHTFFHTQEELARAAGDADVVLATGEFEVHTREHMAVLERCGGIVRMGSGTDDIDVKAATELGIIVANTPHVTADPVADHAISLLFSLVRQVPYNDRATRQGGWHDRFGRPHRRYAGAVLGLVGFGRIPRKIIRKLCGFEMSFLVYDPFVSADFVAARGGRSVPLDELLCQSDYVSLHCALSEQTYHLIGEKELRLMKPEALLVNTSRGSVVDEPALIRALQVGWIAGAALDVFEQEPPDPANPLFKLDNVVVTPHMAGGHRDSGGESLQAMVEAVTDLINRRWPRSVVNPQVKPRWGEMALSHYPED
jgi:D-3-phosphoglycerate dehydrogenase / 2-oxoglutarate reductase